MIRRLPSVLAVMDLPRNSNRRELQRAARILHEAMDTELTERQRCCLSLYYDENLTMQQIAERLGLTRGTVCKHIQKATARLKRASRFWKLGA